tara:strand:+ start:4720 stop:5031 length:312 start_codon:yes stop_codon:yes gene_type:complete
MAIFLTGSSNNQSSAMPITYTDNYNSIKTNVNTLITQLTTYQTLLTDLNDLRLKGYEVDTANVTFYGKALNQLQNSILSSMRTIESNLDTTSGINPVDDFSQI